MAEENRHDREIEQLAAGAGLALQEWTRVEMMLAHLFVSLLDRTRSAPVSGTPWEQVPQQRRLAHSLINSVVAFDARVDLVAAAIEESDLSDELNALWPPIEARLRKKYKSRHEAAHFLIEIQIYSDRPSEVFLFPFATTVTSGAVKKLTRANLDHKAKQFIECGEALYWYRQRVELERGRRVARPIAEPALVQRVRQSLETQKQAAQSPPPQP